MAKFKVSILFVFPKMSCMKHNISGWYINVFKFQWQTFLLFDWTLREKYKLCFHNQQASKICQVSTPKMMMICRNRNTIVEDAGQDIINCTTQRSDDQMHTQHQLTFSRYAAYNLIRYIFNRSVWLDRYSLTIPSVHTLFIHCKRLLKSTT